jgi:hypothetical protein
MTGVQGGRSYKVESYNVIKWEGEALEVMEMMECWR